MKNLDRRGLLVLGTAATTAAVLGGRAQAQNAAAPNTAPQGAAASTASAAPVGDPPPLELFARTPLVAHIALSPDGQRIAFVRQRGDDNFLGFFNLADKKPRNVALSAKKVRGIFWADNTHIVLIDSQTDALPEFAGWKHEFSLAQIVNTDTLELRQVFAHMDGFYNIVSGNLGRIKVNGEYRVTASGYRMGADPELCLYSFPLGNGTPAHEIDEGTRHCRGWVMTPDGIPVAYSEFDDDANAAYKEWTLYLNTAGTAVPHYKKIYSVKGAKDYPELIGLGREGFSVVISVKDAEEEGFHYHEIGADGVLGPRLDTEPGNHSPLFHPTTRRLAGFESHNDWVTYDYFDPLLKKLVDAVPQELPPGYRFTIHDHAEDPRKMIVYGESADDAGTFFFADFTTGDVIQIASNYPDLPAQWITQKQAIDYQAGDGLKIHAYLTLPPGKTPKDLPLVMLPHGGPAARDWIEFDWQAQALASRGYAVLQPNFRGSTGYGFRFKEAGHGEWGRKMQSDLTDGISHLAKQGIVDPKRVAILGASYGGYAALAGATLDPAGTYRCAVDIAGVSDLRGMLTFSSENSGTSYTSANELYWKEWFGAPEHYDDISPVRQAAKAYCPILIIHGTDDTVVPIDQSQRMERALKAAGKDVQFVTYKGQTHWEDIASSRLAMMQAAMDFIQKNNPA